MGSPHCFYNKWFEILCLNHRPHIHLNQNGGEAYEILRVDVSQSIWRRLEIRSNTSHMRVCEDTSILLGPNLTGTPFHYYGNKFMLVGSGIATFVHPKAGKRGCTSVSDGRRAWSDIDYCYGLNCCQADVFGTEIKVDYLSLNAITKRNSCASAYLMEWDWCPKNASLLLDASLDLSNISVPLSLNWELPKAMPGHGFQNNTYCGYDTGFGDYDTGGGDYGIGGNDYNFGAGNNDIGGGDYDIGIDRWKCSCPCGFEGNPYIVDGCQDLIYDCSPPKPFQERNLKSILVGGIFSSILILTATSYLLYKAIRRRINRKLKERMFKRNGGALLQKYLSSNQNIMEKVRLFIGKDMNKATDQFNDNRVLGQGGQGTVYKGMLADGKIVAIKKSKILANANQVEEFINEIIIVSQIDHRNVVKLLGCCLEMDVPLLVYEYIPNGTLYNLIHNDNTDFPLTWEVRLRISLEVAEALAYLHSATSIPIYHRDIKSSNILLDEKYKAKVADFGTSRHIGVDQTHLTTLVKGTFGYLDPEYFQSSQFTEKSDVYSFGVVLVELLTGLKPICFSEEEQSHLNLATRFLLAVEENCVHIILDPQVINTSTEEERESIIRLSQRCLNMNGRNRPSMKEIALELQSIKRSEIPLTVRENSYKKINGKDTEVDLPHIGISFQSSNDSFLCSSF